MISTRLEAMEYLSQDPLLRHLPRHCLNIANQAHEGQVRKYTGEPYIVHPVSVMKLVRENALMYTSGKFLGLPISDIVLSAALLHDTIEDTNLTFGDLEKDLLKETDEKVVAEIIELVFWLTNDSIEGNRATRKKMSRIKMASAPYLAQEIKLADIIDNTRTIKTFDPKFAEVYLEEKRLMIDAIYESRLTSGFATHDRTVSELLKMAVETVGE